MEGAGPARKGASRGARRGIFSLLAALGFYTIATACRRKQTNASKPMPTNLIFSDTICDVRAASGLCVCCTTILRPAGVLMAVSRYRATFFSRLREGVVKKMAYTSIPADIPVPAAHPPIRLRITRRLPGTGCPPNMIVLVVLALWGHAAADLAALAPFAPEEHAPAVKRSAERAAKASRLLADHGHLLPPDLREKAHDLLNEHDFRVHAALDSARPGPALAAIQKKESGYLKAFQKLGGERAATKAKQLPKDEERRKLRATRDVLRAATGLDAEEPVWGAPFRALEELFGEGHAPMEALGVSAKFFEDGTALTQRYHVALQPPCDCWTFGREAVVEQARSVAESLKAPPLVEAWLDSIAADDTGKLPSIGFGVSAEDGACKLYVLNYGGNELPPLPLLDSLPQTARKPDRAPSVLVSVEWKFGDMKTQQMRQYSVEAAEGDVAVARQTQDERFAGDELVAARRRARGQAERGHRRDGAVSIRRRRDAARRRAALEVGPQAEAPGWRHRLERRDGCKTGGSVERRGAGRRSLARTVARRKTRAFQRPVRRRLRHVVQAPDGLRFRGPVLGAAAPRAPKRAHQKYALVAPAALRTHGVRPGRGRLYGPNRGSAAAFVCCLRFVDCCGTSSARLRGSILSSVAEHPSMRRTSSLTHRSGAATRTTRRARKIRRTPRTRGCARNRARTTSRA